MLTDYRRHSSAWTGRACRTTDERWPLAEAIEAPIGFWHRLLVLICGH